MERYRQEELEVLDRNTGKAVTFWKAGITLPGI